MQSRNWIVTRLQNRNGLQDDKGIAPKSWYVCKLQAILAKSFAVPCNPEDCSWIADSMKSHCNPDGILQSFHNPTTVLQFWANPQFQQTSIPISLIPRLQPSPTTADRLSVPPLNHPYNIHNSHAIETYVAAAISVQSHHNPQSITRS